MQSNERRLTTLEAARGKDNSYEHLTDAQLDERIAALLVSLGYTQTTKKGNDHDEQ